MNARQRREQRLPALLVCEEEIGARFVIRALYGPIRAVFKAIAFRRSAYAKDAKVAKGKGSPISVSGNFFQAVRRIAEHLSKNLAGFVSGFVRLVESVSFRPREAGSRFLSWRGVGWRG
jgi:hypothetical protein